MVQKGSSTGILAGVAILAGTGILVILTLISSIGMHPFGWLLYAALVFFGVPLLLGKKSVLPLVAGGVVALMRLLLMFVSRIGVWNVLLLLGDLLLVAVLAAGLLPQLKSLGERVKDFYFVPAILIGVPLLVTLVSSVRALPAYEYMPPMFRIYFILSPIVRLIAYTVGAFFAGKWAFEKEAPAGFTRYAEGYQTQGGTAAGAVPAAGEGYIDMVKHVLLLLFTFGIWLLIWIYRTTEYTNRVRDEERRDPTGKLLLCMFVPFYLIYWTYKTAQRIDKLSVERGLPGDSATLMLVLEIVFSILPPIMMQDKINKIASAPAGSFRTSPPQNYAPQNYAPQNYAPENYAPQNYAPENYAPQPDAPQTYAPENYAPQPEAPQNYAPENYAPQPDAPQTYGPRAGAAAELRQYKQLLDDGVITPEEFEAKKKQILGI